MDDNSIFQKMDAEERMYAPEQLPVSQQGRVLADEGAVQSFTDEPPSPGIVASVGNSTSSQAAVPNMTNQDEGGLPGDPATQARDPFGAPPDENVVALDNVGEQDQRRLDADESTHP